MFAEKKKFIFNNSSGSIKLFQAFLVLTYKAYM